MAAQDTRWKNPPGKDPEQLFRWAQDLISELRKGTYLDKNGFVVGPASSTDNTLARWNGTTGKLLKDGTAVGTTDIADNAVTYAKMQDVSATSRILGRKTASAGDTEECTLSDVLDFIGSPAQGDVLYRGASTWARLGAGTSGQFLKTLGAAANPAWATVPADWVLLTSGSVSSAATLDLVLTSYTSYRTLFLIVGNFIPATNDVDLWFRVSTDGGSTYNSGSTDYRYAGTATFTNAQTHINVSTGAAQFFVGDPNAGAHIGNGSDGGISGVLTLIRQTDTAIRPHMNFDGCYDSSSHTFFSNVHFAGQRVTAQDTDALRVLFSSGNISSGNYGLYGVT